MANEKEKYLNETIQHIDITEHNVVSLVDSMAGMAFQARNLHRAASIYDRMIADSSCSVILCLAGSLFSAGLKKVVYDMIRHNMVDAIVSTGAIMVDQDFFEAIGFKHYIGSPYTDDNDLRELRIDRIYDTYIDEDQLCECDETVGAIADTLEPRPYSSRAFIKEMGRYLDENGSKVEDSVILAAYKHNVPIFVPAFSDCSAGFGLLDHQHRNPDKHVSIDSVRDFYELTQLKIKAGETGILMIGGGVPKNFVQDVTLSPALMDKPMVMHKYAIQVTVADERDGALSGSTLREANSWGKVKTDYEQMVYSEATIAMPLIVGYAFHKGSWKNREPRNFQSVFTK